MFRSLLTVSLCLIPFSLDLQAKLYEQVPVVSESLSDSPEGDQTVVNPLVKLLKQGPKAKWIWGANHNTPYTLMKTFDSTALDGRLIATCDNQMTLFLNGQQIAASTTWENPVEVDVSRHLKAGKNVLSAQVKNAGGSRRSAANSCFSWKTRNRNISFPTKPGWRQKVRTNRTHCDYRPTENRST